MNREVLLCFQWDHHLVSKASHGCSSTPSGIINGRYNFCSALYPRVLSSATQKLYTQEKCAFLPRFVMYISKVDAILRNRFLKGRNLIKCVLEQNGAPFFFFFCFTEFMGSIESQPVAISKSQWILGSHWKFFMNKITIPISYQRTFVMSAQRRCIKTDTE